MPSYTNIFGGNNINTAFPSYNSYALTGNITLNWATSFVDNANVVALINDFTANAATYIVTLPDARLISVGQDIRFNNVGANNITFHDNQGNFLFTLAPTQVFDIYLSNNTTQGGTWRITQFGAGTAQAQATNLVVSNSSLTVTNGFITSNMPNVPVAGNYQLIATDRGNLFVWTGGVGTLTLPPLANAGIGNGYTASFNNRGGGTVTINTTDGSTIDGNATLLLKPGQSCTIDGGAPGNLLWNTIGLGLPSVFAYTSLNLNVAASVNVVLTNQQAANQIITFTGLLTASITVTFPAVTGAWYVNNATTGLFTITTLLNGSLLTILVPQGEKLILYSDGTNLYNTPTLATSVIFNDGTSANPSIVFASDSTSGFYKVGAGTMGYSSLGANVMSFGALSGGQTGFALAAGDVLRLVGTNAGHYATLNAGNMAANVNWTWPVADSASNGGILQSNAAGTLAFTTATYPTSTTINQILYSSAANTITGLATANNSTLITSGAGVPSLSATLPAAVQGNITTLGTITAGVWNGTSVTVPFGGTGLATLTTAYGVVCAGTTATGALQNAGTGGTGQVLTSQGAASLPTWLNIYPAKVLLYGNTSGVVTLSLNVSSLVNAAAGIATVTFTAGFSSSTSYVVIGNTIMSLANNPRFFNFSTPINANSIVVATSDLAGISSNNIFMMSAFGQM